MLWEYWSNLSYNQQAGLFTAIPFFLFFMDLVVKNGFNLSIVTAGGDLCLAAVALDISQGFLAISNSSPNIELSCLLFMLALGHLFLWASSLRLVSLNEHSSLYNFRTGVSYCFGLLAFYTSLGTILQFTVQKVITHG